MSNSPNQSSLRYCNRFGITLHPVRVYQPPAAIGSSSDGIAGGGKWFFISFGSLGASSGRPPVAIGSSSDGVTGGGRNLFMVSWRQGGRVHFGSVIAASLNSLSNGLGEAPDLVGLRRQQTQSLGSVFQPTR